jgi:hypothetical protein
MKIFALLLMLCVSNVSLAQQGAGVDSSHSPDTTLHRNRPLPPSIADELRRGQKARTIVFQDTLRSDDLTKLHFNDSAERAYADSAISLYDTAVSLPHQEWLDSELFEIPELARFGVHVHFNYSPEIMTETYQLPVSFDSTLLSGMDPVTRENLPFFDQSPIPIALGMPKANESFLDAGAGNVDLPQLKGWFSQSLSDRTTLQGLAEYQSLDESKSAIHNYANVIASLDAQLGVDPSIQTFESQDLKVSAGYNAKSVAIGGMTSQEDRTLSDITGAASYVGNATEKLHYEASICDHEFNDNSQVYGSESELEAKLFGRYNVDNYRIIADGGYSRGSLNTGANYEQFYGTNQSISPISSEYEKLLFGEQVNYIEWYAGAEFLGGDGTSGASYSSLLPVVRVRVALDDKWSVGGNFEPQVQLVSIRELANINPFYSPDQIKVSFPPSFNAGSIVMDKFNLDAFLQYFISNDDEVRFEGRYVEKSRDVVFNTASVDSETVFTATAEDTRTLSFSASGNFLLFARDMLDGSVEYSSATIVSTGNAAPYEPNFKFDATYRFNSIWENIRPSITFRSISRPGKTFNFIDADVNIKITHSLECILSAENILDGASDFWPGYPECPQSIVASLKYSF